MKIGIVTQPLQNNYGGILQNYALQKILKDLGHQVVTYDRNYKSTPWWMYLCSWVKSFIYLFIPGKRRPFAKITSVEKRFAFIQDFISKNISLSVPTTSISHIFDNNIDAIVVGSDQIWRPKYAPNIEESYLNFANTNVRKIAYAVSFGVDYWEYSSKQTLVCSLLAKKFDSISVREESGVVLCKKYLGVKAAWVLDPTLLIKREDYLKLCCNIPIEKKKILAAYVLNLDERILSLCNSLAKEHGLELKFFSADCHAELSIPEWLAFFRDASYVVTDSFHGTVFSIIFKKDFKCLYNESRGSTRFDSLMKLYESGKLEENRIFSLSWLKNALEF